MWLGVDYYPEQWDSALLETDLDTIVDLGCTVIRIGEFAWHKMEKTEGQYDFSFFDHIIARAKAKGLRVIMGTPTATIPAWLAAKHPDILSAFENGQKRAFGGRHVCCYNSSVLYDYTRKIIQAELAHFQKEDAIIAWQIDNELGHEDSDICWCANCRKAFQRYLEQRFDGQIDALNDTYGTAFWSQEYNSFDEIPLPAATITTHNPALRLDWERFRSKSIEKFANFQMDLIRKALPNAVLIHDFPGGGLAKHVDYSRVAAKLDIVAYNNYPVWGGQKEPLTPHQIAFALDYIRGLKRQNFWITEAIMGAQGHDVTGFLPRPNQAKLWSWQGMARGCDSLLYFRYRSGLKGAEQFCYGILDADNRKGRKYREVQSFFAEVKPYAAQFESPVAAPVAMLYDYDSLAAFRIQRQSLLLDCQSEMERLYKPFYNANVMMDILPANTNFSSYKILLLPLLILDKPALRQRVYSFVENGGLAVFTFRSAVKDADNNLVFGEVLPLGYSLLTGVTVEETESLQEEEAFPLVGCGDCAGQYGRGGIFRDMLYPNGAEVLYRYGDDFYSSYAAITRHTYGKGAAYYIGCSPDKATLDRLVQRILAEAGLPMESSSDGVEIVYRGNGAERIRIAMNHNAHSVMDRNTVLNPFECKITPARVI